jgi:hypothetical protein
MEIIERMVEEREARGERDEPEQSLETQIKYLRDYETSLRDEADRVGNIARRLQDQLYEQFDAFHNPKE